MISPIFILSALRTSQLFLLIFIIVLIPLHTNASSIQFDKKDTTDLPPSKRLHKKGIAHLKKRELTDAALNFKACIRLAKEEQNTIEQGKCTSNLASTLFSENKYIDALPLYLEAVELFKNSDSNLYAQELLNAGWIYSKLNMYDSALVYYYTALPILSKNADQINLMKGYNFLATTLRHAGNKSPLLFFNKSLELAKSIKDTVQLAAVYNNIGNFYLEEKLPDSAIIYYDSSLQLKFDPQKIAISHLNIGKAYYEKKEYSSAEKHLLESQEVLQKSNNKASLFKNYIEVLRLYDVLHNKNQILKYIQKADSLSSLFSPSLYDRHNYLLQKRKLLIQSELYLDALEISDEIILVKDSLITNENKNISLKYEAIFNVNEWKNAYTLETIKREQDIVNYRWAGLLIILALIIILFYAYNRATVAKSAEIHFKELNHRTNNLLTIFSSLISHQKTDNETNTLHHIKNQIKTLNIVYRHLNTKKANTNKITRIDNFIIELTENLCFSMGIGHKKLTIDKQITPVFIHEKQINPLALIITEIIINAIKYSADNKGHLHLSFCLEEYNDEIELTIKDGGKGRITAKENNEGSSIINLLARQLRGHYSYGDNNTSDFYIKFKKRG